jgi:hypothetical protein
MSRMTFKNYGGSYQLRIRDSQDLEKIQVLDEVHWAAISIPTNSLNCDKAFTSYVDTDNNGRIRPSELKAAWSWLTQVLADRRRMSEGSDILRLQDIDTHNSEGQKLLAAAKLILTNLNMPTKNEISLAQVRDVQSIMANAENNGDGIIPPEVTVNADLARFITAIMDTVGSRMDACGKPGIGEEELKAFLNEAEAYLAWKAQGEIPKGQEYTEIMPWGIETEKAYDLIQSVEEKIEQFFAQCALVKFDKRAAAQMQLREQELAEIDFTDTVQMLNRLKGSPLLLPNLEGVLYLEGEINPLYAAPLLELREKIFKRVLGKSVERLNEKDWRQVKNTFRSYQTWFESKQGDKVEKIGQNQLRSYIEGSYQVQTNELIEKDLAVANDLNQIKNLEKVILYQRWLMVLANNFVSFADLYNPTTRALFEMGTLIIDERQICFTMSVRDRETHKKASKRSSMHLLYVEVTGRQDTDAKFEIVAPVTSGSAEGLHIGKRGIFFTVDGCEWDAEVVDIVVNPISVSESVKVPFQNFAAFIKKQFDKTAKSSEEKLVSTSSSASTSGAARDLMLGGGLAIAALGSSFAYITQALSQVKPTQVLITLLGLAMVVLLPGILSGFVKIRKRDMSGLLEASGWAVNVRMRINTKMGRLFTHRPYLPKKAHKKRRDVVGKFIKELECNVSQPIRSATYVFLLIFFVLCAISVYIGIYRLS